MKKHQVGKFEEGESTGLHQPFDRSHADLQLCGELLFGQHLVPRIARESFPGWFWVAINVHNPLVGSEATHLGSLTTQNG